MKKIMDKLKQSSKRNKKIIIFLIVLGVIALVSGSIFNIMLNNTDKQLIIDYINNFISNISNNQLNYTSALKNGLISSISFIVIIWLLGMSVIGIPIILFMYFCKIFILGFSISSIISIYKLKGCLISFSYVFPHHIINLIMYTVLVLSALKVSSNILYAALKKDNVNFKTILHKYLYIFIISLVTVIIMTLFEVYITPRFIKIFLPLIN